MKKRLISAFLAILILCGIFASTVAVSYAADVKAYASGDHNAMEIAESKGVLGMHVYINGDFTSVAFAMPTWSVSGQYSAYISVYEWTINYKTTMENEPVATQEFTELKDNATNKMTFDALSAGEYFICIEKTSGHVGCWMLNGTSVSKGFMMNDGIEQDKELELIVGFAGAKPNEPFLQVESQAASYGEAPTFEQVTADQTDLSKYNLPESSLYLKNDVLPDTWVFTDGLGRKALTNADVGDPKENKTVFIFYSDWHTSMSSSKPFNVQEFLDAEAAKGVDISTIINDYGYSGWPTSGVQNFWNEPIYGYYRTDDPWVLRRQAELLANAGIDAISTDNTNGTFTWKNSYTAIYETWYQAQLDGVNSPKVTYMLPFSGGSDTNAQLESIYLDIFREGKYQSLWYWLDGKPFMLAHKEGLNKSSNALQKEIYEFFTYRSNYPGYINSSPANGAWGWLSVYPQAYYYGTAGDRKNNNVEQITVGVAQNHNAETHQISAMNGPNNTSRTFTKKNGYDLRENAKLYGANFQEQWDYALEINPAIVYVTGWNEWIAGRYDVWSGVTNAFPDQFNDENSRDIEPSRGDLKDHYYYQLVNNVRKYKGVNAIPTPTTASTIDITKGIDQWATVEPYYATYIGNTCDRDYDGYSGYHYTDKSGRNDIIGTQMARDDEYIYILVECAENITSYTDRLWMNILLDTDGESFGWESYDYVINKTTPKSANIAYLEKFTGNGYETAQVAEVEYSVDGRYMQVKIKKSDLGISGYDFTVNYSITDNVHDEDDTEYTVFSGDILNFYTSGDVAPGGRFQYSYVSTKENAGFASDETTAEDTTAVEIGDDETTAQNGETVGPEITSDGADTTSSDEEKAGCCGTVAVAFIPAVIIPVFVFKKKKKNI